MCVGNRFASPVVGDGAIITSASDIANIPYTRLINYQL